MKTLTIGDTVQFAFRKWDQKHIEIGVVVDMGDNKVAVKVDNPTFTDLKNVVLLIPQQDVMSVIQEEQK